MAVLSSSFVGVNEMTLDMIAPRKEGTKMYGVVVGTPWFLYNGKSSPSQNNTTLKTDVASETNERRD
jgi:hypothetical protein